MTNSHSQRDLVLIRFPFSNKQEFKIRPVVVMSNDDYNKKFSDFIAIPLTSNLKLRDHALLITNRQMETGVLKADSKAKVDKISSIDKETIIKKIGRINKDTYNELKKMLLSII